MAFLQRGGRRSLFLAMALVTFLGLGVPALLIGGFVAGVRAPELARQQQAQDTSITGFALGAHQAASTFIAFDSASAATRQRAAYAAEVRNPSGRGYGVSNDSSV